MMDDCAHEQAPSQARCRTLRWGLLVAVFLCGGLCACPATTTPAKVGGGSPAGGEGLRLVVQVTVDQLRADLPLRLRDRFGAAGFVRFLDQGTVYDNAHYAHAITETAVGHATLFTGALPKDHGIVGNEWYDLQKRAREYAVDDDSAKLVGTEGGGKSPHNLLVPTLGDALIAATDGKALVRAISEKDRGSILPAGMRGLAYWLDDSAGSFVSSRYYLDARPAWVSDLTVARYKDTPLSFTPKSGSTKDFTRALKHTPYSDELVLELVRVMFEHEPLGRDDVPDLLSISFSATDYVGHAFGPESTQAADNLVQLDRTLASLLMLLDERVGVAHVLIVLSADHGIAESPEWFLARGEDAGRIDPSQLVKDLNEALRIRFSLEVDLVLDFVNPSLWLDEAAIRARGLDLLTVERTLAELVRLQRGFFAAFAREDVLAGKVMANALERRVTHSVHPTRSGHVYVVPKPRWLLATETSEIVAMHGTPHEYDTHVPIYVLGQGVPAAHVARAVDPRDLAPTLARFLHIDPPSGSTGQVLREVVGD